ncbi:MAG TPA: phosphate acyltransferase, partial [Planctomycetota bacterium]
HDDQHGTALITGAALMNALEIAGKQLADVRVVVNGAGAAAVACMNLAIRLGMTPENVIMCDSKGVLYEGRTEGINEYKAPFLRKTGCRTLADAMVGADVFVGVSVGNVVDADMLRSMAANPVVLAMANPDPEIDYPVAKAARPDVIMATGRSDYPNQVNNVLGFPYVFRGALDVQASCINDTMLLAATRALAELAKEPVPEAVARAYGLEQIDFGRDYFVPKPLDHRVIRRVAAAVAQAAIDTGVARRPVEMEAYVRKLGERLGEERDLMDTLVTRASKSPRRIGYPEGEDEKCIIAAEAVVQERIAKPVLIGNDTRIHALAAKIGVSLNGVAIVDPARSPDLAAYGEELARIRSHRGRTLEEAMEQIVDPAFFGCMMLRKGDLDGLVCGVTRQVRKSMPPILKVVPLRAGVRRAASMTMAFTRRGLVFLADTAVNIEPGAEELAEIAILAADEVRYLGIEPVVAMLSFSSYGGTRHPRSDMVRQAVELARQEAPDLLIDGEMRLDAAIDPTVQARYPLSRLQGRKANVLVFPNLEAANIGFNMMRYYADASLVGPIMLGLERPAHMLQPHSAGVSEVVRLTAIAVLDARRAETAVGVGV